MEFGEIEINKLAARISRAVSLPEENYVPVIASIVTNEFSALAEDDMEAAKVTLRERWPGCSFQIAQFTNAGFDKEPTFHVEIGVISKDYMMNERWEANTLAEALSAAMEGNTK